MKTNTPIILIYKRTHKGDPDSNGIFGIHECLGKVRNRKYDAVIGIGGKSPWRGEKNISLKVNWIGLTPSYNKSKNKTKNSLVSFLNFCLFDDKGPLIKKIAPNLYNHMYVDCHRRIVMSSSLPPKVYSDALKILKLAKNCPPSKGLKKTYKEIKDCK